MKRIAGIILTVAGALCLLAAVATFLVAPQFIRLPDQGSLPTVILTAPGATVMQTGTGTPQAGPADLQTTTRTEAAGSTSDGAVIWNVLQTTVASGSTTPLSATQSKIALDAQTGAAVPWSGQCLADAPAECQPGNVSFSGQLYQFPIGTEQKTYQFFDTTLRAPLPIAYRGTEKVEGLSTYRFEQTVPEQQSNLDAQLLAALTAALPPALRAAAAGAKLSYQSTRTVWVEPTTGTIVDYREHVQRAVVLPVGGQSIPLLDADFRYTPQTRANIAGEAGDGITVIRTLRWYLPIGLAVLGIAGLVIGLLLLRRRATPPTDPAGPDTPPASAAATDAPPAAATSATSDAPAPPSSPEAPAAPADA